MAYDKAEVSITLVDAFGRKAVKRVEMVTTDAATMETDAATIANAYADASEMDLLKYEVRGIMEQTATPAAGANRDAGVTIRAQLHGRSEQATVKIPAPKTDEYVNADGTVDLTDPLITAIESLYDATSAIARLSDGELIDSFVGGTLDK